MGWIFSNILCPPEAARAVRVVQGRQRAADDLLGRGQGILDHVKWNPNFSFLNVLGQCICDLMQRMHKIRS